MKFLKMNLHRIVLIACLLIAPILSYGQEMNNTNLEEIFKNVCDTVSGGEGAWEITLDGLKMLCMTDSRNNRMRIICPVAEMKEITQEQVMEAMEANFHSALDVKYAIANDYMWVAFIHPLKELSEYEVLSAITQVFNAHLTFGTLYSSTDLAFPNAKKQLEKKKEKKLKRS